MSTKAERLKVQQSRVNELASSNSAPKFGASAVPDMDKKDGRRKGCSLHVVVLATQADPVERVVASGNSMDDPEIARACEELCRDGLAYSIEPTVYDEDLLQLTADAAETPCDEPKRLSKSQIAAVSCNPEQNQVPEKKLVR